MIVTNTNSRFENTLERILRDLNLDKRSSYQVLQELLVIRFINYIDKSNTTDKIIKELSRLLYPKNSEFVNNLKLAEEVQSTMKRIINLSINPKKI